MPLFPILYDFPAVLNAVDNLFFTFPLFQVSNTIIHIHTFTCFYERFFLIKSSFYHQTLGCQRPGPGSSVHFTLLYFLTLRKLTSSYGSFLTVIAQITPESNSEVMQITPILCLPLTWFSSFIS